MSRMKTFFKYALWVIVFFIFSQFLISVALNSNYRNITRRDDEKQIKIYQAQATTVNGRIKGIVTDKENEGRFVKIELYSERNVNMGKAFIEIEKFGEHDSVPFEANFKLEHVASYKVSIVDKKDENTDNLIDLLVGEATNREVIFWTIAAILILK